MKLNLFFFFLICYVNLVIHQPQNLERKKDNTFHPHKSHTAPLVVVFPFLFIGNTIDTVPETLFLLYPLLQTLLDYGVFVIRNK